MLNNQQNPTQEDHSEKIYNAARRAVRKGWSVIPVNYRTAGRVDKTPAVPWAMYQERRPDAKTLSYWNNADIHEESLFAGLGIVCGDVSGRLLVIDADSMERAEYILENFEAARRTMRELTPRGMHFYFFAAPDAPASSRALHDVDVLFNGKYSVAAPTPGYSLVSDAKPVTLNAADYNALLRLLQPRRDDSPAKRDTQQPERVALERRDNVTPVGMADVIRFYNAKLQHKGRNDSVFAALCFARDNALSMNECVTGGLYDAFVRTPAPSGHSHETLQQRGREFMRTAKSAYSRAPRVLQGEAPISVISDNARQNLHKAGLGNAARVIDALFAVGFQSGQVFSQGEATKALQGIVYRKGVCDALESILPSGKRLFFRASERPSPRAPQPGTPTAGNTTTKMLFVHRKKPEKTISGDSGRPAKRYIMPDLEAIQRLTEAEYRASTPLKLSHIESPSKYRAKLLSGLLERRPGTYAQDSLGDWYGVTGRTIRNYLQTIDGLKVIRQSERITPIGWDNVDAILSEFNSELDSAYFLRDDYGHNYPAVKGAAIMALYKGKRLVLRRRKPNYYAIGAASVPKTDEHYRAEARQILENQAARMEKDINPALQDNIAAYWQRLQQPPRSSRPEQPEAAQNGYKPDYLNDEAFIDFAAHLSAIVDYWSEDTLDGLQGFSEATMNHLERDAQRRQHEAALEAAKTSCVLINGVVTDDRLKLGLEAAVALALEFGGDSLKQAALKIVTQYQMQRGEAAKLQKSDDDRQIQNPAGLLTYRLRRAEYGEKSQ